MPVAADFRSHRAVRRLLRLALFLLLGLTVGRPCLAVEDRFELIPLWVRPGPTTIVTVKLSEGIDTSNKMFLRLTEQSMEADHASPKAVQDLALDSEQVRKRLAQVKIPGPLRRGIYKTELVGEGGVVLAVGPEELKVAASEKPSITKIFPNVAYPRSDGRFDVEIIGENFSHTKAQDLKVRINDVLVKFASLVDDEKSVKTVTDCGGKLPCLIWNWRTLRIFGLSPESLQVYRPLEVSVEVDQLISDDTPLLLSRAQRYVPRAIAFGVLGVVVALVYLLSRQKAAQHRSDDRIYSTLAYLLIDQQTNTYSLSKFQLLTWTSAVVVAYAYLGASQFLVQWKWVLPNVPEGLPMLLGLSATTTAVAVGATEFRGSKGAGQVHPELGDLITTGGVFAPERLQFFLWTILGAFAFICATLVQDPGTANKMVEIPDTFNQLMGASSLGYLAGKFARKPGPVIKELDPLPPYDALTFDSSRGIRIVGENLSPHAQVRLNGALLPGDQVEVAPQQPKGREFVSELIVKPKEVAAAIDGVPPLKVINPDGQSADM